MSGDLDLEQRYRRVLRLLPGYYLLVPVPVLVIQATGNQAWLPDSAGLGCLVVSLFCLVASLITCTGVRLNEDNPISDFAIFLTDPSLIPTALAVSRVLSVSARRSGRARNRSSP